MAGIQLDGVFSDPFMPFERASDGVLAIPTIRWFQAAPSLVDIEDGKIVRWHDRAGSGATLEQADPARRALFVEDAPNMGGNAAHFTPASSAESIQYTIKNSGFNAGAAFSVSAVALFSQSSSQSTNKFLFGVSGSPNFYMGRTAANVLRMHCGGSGVGNAEVSIDETKWHSSIGSFNGADRVNLSVDGSAAVSSNSATVPAPTGDYVFSGIASGGGVSWEGYVCDIRVLTIDLFHASNEAHLAALRAFDSSVYGLG
ncbi:hypothetical protein JET14_11885 [Martelella lutilitoris]|uniref:LamG domain-containing protein n=1 Tax=Martelella lutilitoris TaxID=2583532 RepID=A0A7T7HH11_9HYPH|nr:LamG-like jellyroll fold domain-containing protein [Martelella lutilitoris]QQM29040.1 hypothetical protein JET14_11885 [Martelella lutilitoris]